MSVKLYGGYSGASKTKKSAPNTKGNKPAKKRTRTALDRVITVFMVLVVLEGLYCTAVFSNIGVIKKYRDLWIQTAMSTMTHQWLATYFIPQSVIDEVMARVENAQNEQIGVNSQWDNSQTAEPSQEQNTPATPEDAFYETFWELDRNSMEAYIKENPSVTANGWDKISINESGLNDKGTSINTTMGEQVLAIDAQNKILLVRVSGTGYRGVLAIAKDPAKLSLQASKSLGSAGECAGDIAQDHNGILAMTGSGFIDEGGNGNGGTLAGYAMMNGEERGLHMGWSYKRLELHEDNRFYITDAQESVSTETTDAVEFMPALIVDGKSLVDENNDWNGINPRACMGQSDKDELLMLVIEGRQTASLGTGVAECVKILQKHNCMQAMNLDGGTSAIMWYDGAYITRCSNQSLPSGRPLPNAFVYEKIGG